MTTVQERFLKYVGFDTTSDGSSDTCPSTAGQLVLAKALLEEMRAMGIKNAVQDENGYLYGEIPSTTENSNAPSLAFIAHMDTSPDLSGASVKPRVVKNYDGGDIVLNAEQNIVLSPEQFEHLTHYVGQDLIVTDGTTLLGADNKAGIAEILTMAAYLIEHPEIPHGPIKIAFTPDEEIGRGANRFNLETLGADFGYTVDGGEIGELEYENFNAATAVVTVKGQNIHPGSAKGQMKNALLIGMAFNALLPACEIPACTEGYEGFSHLNDFTGCVETAEMVYIIRDHDRALFEQKKALFQSAAVYLNTVHGADTLTVSMTDSYYNMKEKVMPHFHLIETAEAAMQALGIVPKIVPIRGGTDGARLSFMGLPCPNLCTGGHNFHGRYEYIPVQSMEKTVALLVEIAKRYSTFE